MARPPAGSAPVNRSLVGAEAELPVARRDVVIYNNIVDALRRPDRRADLRAMLGSDAEVDRFLAVAFNSIATQSGLLMNCTGVSIVQAIKDAATLGLEPTGLTGEAVIYPYKDVAKLVPMWRGYLKRIRNSGKVQDIDTRLIYVNDEFDHWTTASGFEFMHHPVRPAPDESIDSRGAYWGAIAWAVMPSGFKVGEVMPAADINREARDKSESWRNEEKRASSPWATHWGEMARKTVLRRLSKRLPQEAVAVLLALDEDADRTPVTVEDPTMTSARRVALAAIASRSSAPDVEPTTPVMESAPGLAMADEPSETYAIPSETAQGAPEAPEAVSVGVCGAASPYEAGSSPCVLDAGHAGLHRNDDRESW
jgi:recombination protein RecT